MPNKKYIISLLIAFVSISYSYSQSINDEYADYTKLDSITFADYTNKNWEGVIHYGNIAIENNIDYYYLRIRMGIAYFYLEKYLDAANNLQKALKFNENDALAQLYLYDTYIILGKNTKAYKLSKSFSSSTMNLISKKRKLIEFIDIGGGYSLSNNYDLNDKVYYNNNNDTLSGYQELIGDKSVFTIGANFNLSPSFSIYAGYTNLQIDKIYCSQYFEVPLKFDSVQNETWGYQNYYSPDTIQHHHTNKETIQQNEIYVNGKYQLSNGWALTLFTNLIFVNSVNYTPIIDTVVLVDTNYQITGQDPVLFEYDYYHLRFDRADTSFLDFIAGFNIEKDFNNVTLNLFGTISSLNGAKQSQLGTSGFYYLNSNASIYGNTQLTWFSQRQKQSNNDSRLIFTQKIGGKLLSKLWAEAEFGYGNLQNANINNGSIVFNQSDKTNCWGGVNLKLPLTKNIELNLYYKYIRYEGEFYLDIMQNTEQKNKQNTNSFNYQTQNIIGGLKWKF